MRTNLLKQRLQTPAAKPGTGEEAPVLEALICDAHLAALLTAAVTSAVNSFKSPASTCSAAKLQTYVPQETATAISIGSFGSQAAMSPGAMQGLVAFYADLDPARRQLSRFFTDNATLGPERAKALYRFALSGAWRGVCQSAIAAVRLLQAETEGRVPQFYELNSGILIRLLQDAAAGETPCIDEKGELFLPVLPQRRQSSRRVLGQSAVITVGHETFRAFARDVSVGGLGLEQVPILEQGRSIKIQLSTGRRFAGTIAWYRKGRAGVRFDTPLLPLDPMLWV